MYYQAVLNTIILQWCWVGGTVTTTGRKKDIYCDMCILWNSQSKMYTQLVEIFLCGEFNIHREKVGFIEQ